MCLLWVHFKLQAAGSRTHTETLLLLGGLEGSKEGRLDLGAIARVNRSPPIKIQDIKP